MSTYDDPRRYEQQPEDRPYIEHPPQPGQPQPQPGYNDPYHSPSFILPEDDPQQQPVGRSPEPSRTMSRLLRRIATTLVLLAIAFLAGWFSHEYFSPRLDQSNQSAYYAQLFQQAWTKVDQNYVDRNQVDYQKMSYAAINSMVQSLDDKGHTRFMTPQDVQAEKQSLSGKFTGIGVYLHQDKDSKALVITSAIPNSPADKAGLKHGDVIIAVNGASTAGKDINGVSALIQGKEGTSVEITVQRPGVAQPMTFKMTRAVIQAPNVILHYIPESHIAHIQLIQFSTGVSDQLRDAVTQAKKEGATKIILDMRDNGGGFLDEAQKTASLFLKEDSTILLQQDSKGTRTATKTIGTPLDTQIPLVVLVNGNSASATEIVSGALQDNHRATIIGDKTFGTGTVLQQFDLDDGSAILIGVQEWLTPNGHFIRKDDKGNGGITPDVSVSLGQNDTQLAPNDENANNMSQQQILSSSDKQLIKAIQYLNGQK